MPKLTTSLSMSTLVSTSASTRSMSSGPPAPAAA